MEAHGGFRGRPVAALHSGHCIVVSCRIMRASLLAKKYCPNLVTCAALAAGQCYKLVSCLHCALGHLTLLTLLLAIPCLVSLVLGKQAASAALCSLSLCPWRFVLLSWAVCLCPWPLALASLAAVAQVGAGAAGGGSTCVHGIR